MKITINRIARRLTVSIAIVLALATSGAWAADWTVSDNTTLTEDKTVDTLTVESGITLNLNGYSLACTSLAGEGTITSLCDDPDLTSPQGTVTGTYLNDSGADTPLSGGSYAALFDDDFSTYGNPHRLLSGSLANGKFLTVVYDFGEGAATVVNKFKLYNGANGEARNPYVWKFEGTNDKDSEWTTLQSVGGYTHEGNTWTYTGSLSESWGSAVSKTNVVHTFENTTAYRYYRFVFIKTGAAYCELKQIELFNTTAGELHVNVADGVTVNSTVAFSGNVKVVKEGNGTLSGITQIANGLGTTVKLVVDGGSVTATTNLEIGKGNGVGALTINSGVVEVPGAINTMLTPNDDTSSTGTINLNAGGTLKTRRIFSRDAARGTLNFNGGTLQANAEAKTEQGVELTGGLIVNSVTTIVNEGGGMIDSGNLAIKVGSAIGGTGAMRFKGGNTVTLQGESSHSGGTTIELGTKVVTSDATTKDTILGDLVIDGKALLANTNGVEVFQYNSTLADPADLANVVLVHCGVGSTKYIDGNSIKVDFVSPTEWVLDANKTWSALVTQYGEPADDAIVHILATGNYTLTVDQDVEVSQIEFTVGTGSTLTVAADNTLTTGDISGIGKILNYGTIVKTGSASVDWPFDNASTGVYVISEGRINVKSHTGTINAGSSQVVRVKRGATFDTRGVNGHNFSVVLEEGSRLANSSNNLGGNASQAMGLTLEGDATLVHHRTFGLRAPQHAVTTLALGTYTLTLDSSGKQSFILDNTTITGTGTIFVKNGTLYVTMNDSVGEDCTVSVGSGAELNLGKNLTVGNFVNNGTIIGSGMLTVLGKLTPGNTITNLTLASGATIKATGTAQEVSTTFTATGSYAINASEITKVQLDAAEDQRIPVLTVQTSNKGGTWTVVNPPVDGCRAKWVDNGNNTSTLYIVMPTGMIMMVY